MIASALPGAADAPDVGAGYRSFLRDMNGVMRGALSRTYPFGLPFAQPAPGSNRALILSMLRTNSVLYTADQYVGLGAKVDHRA